MVDIFLTCYERQEFAQECVKYLRERTITPYRLTVIDNGGNQWAKDQVDRYVPLWTNTGIHYAWNTALSMAEGEYFITSDPDLLVPDLDHVDFTQTNQPFVTSTTQHGDWLERMIKFMNKRPDYGAISMHPHILIGAAGFDPQDPEDVKEVDHCGAVFRIMRTEVVKQAGGWEFTTRPQRNHEEKHICSRLREKGFKSGRTTRVRAYHLFGKDNWGYGDIPPEVHGHNPALRDYVGQFDQKEAYNQETWLPKI